jgi:peptide/nickel transport system ATP-binding protein/oligopeptide transport system ATP-binding protein
MNAQAALHVRDLSTRYVVKRGGRTHQVEAVRGVSFTLARGEVLGIVGESGCGKTSVARSLVGLARPHAGEVLLGDQNILKANAANLRALRLKIRMVFQDPFASLNPRRSVGDSVAETGDIHRLFRGSGDRDHQVEKTLSDVGLDASFAGRFPHELSGGQRQRVGIARAILPTPDIIIADEPVSALDVSVQAQVLNLLADLREKIGLSMIFISHDLGVVSHVSDRVAVMYMGRIVEMAATRAIIDQPVHPYTRTLMAARPKPDPKIRIKPGMEIGEPPSQFERAEGCPYVKRCPIATSRCALEDPKLRQFGPDRLIACHNV